MIFIENSYLIESLGWTLLHSLWQGALVALVLFAVLRMLRATTANRRYLAACTALFLVALLPAITFLGYLKNAPAANHISGKFFDSWELMPGDSLNETEKVLIEQKQISLTRDNLTNKAPLSGNLYWLEKQINAGLPVLVALWFCGLLWQILRLNFGFRQLRRLQHVGIFPVSKEWGEKFKNLKDELKIKQTVRLLQSSLVRVPAAIGWLKPVVIVPTSAFLHLAPQELETIIRHELNHIRRLDYLVNALQSLVEAVMFYHPAAWWISSIIRSEREFACDDAVVSEAIENRLIYARALANLEQLRPNVNHESSNLALAADGGKLSVRIRRIIKPKNDDANFNTISTMMSGAILLLISVALVYAVGSHLDAPRAAALNDIKTKKLAIGFVSIPPNNRIGDSPNDSLVTSHLMIKKLQQYKIPAIGFVVGAMISDEENASPKRAEIVRLWRDAGLEIGIGNYKHLKFYDTSFDEYVSSVEKNERITRKILAEKNLPLRYFSYPYLNTGKNADERNRFEASLNERGITPVKYTIDNQEWMYSYAYDLARKNGDQEKMRQIRTEFLDYMSKMFTHYEQYSQEMFGRDINQTMVLTPSRLVADSADDLFGMIENRGYNYVSMDDALSDEAFKTPENFVGKSGISWFERWQMVQGKKLLDEPQVSRAVWDIWNNRDGNK